MYSKLGEQGQSHLATIGLSKVLKQTAFLCLVAVCAALLASCSIVIAVVPFRKMARWLGRNQGGVHFDPAAGDCQIALAKRFGRAIQTASRHVPYRADCYPQALSAWMLCALARIPTALHFGARLDGDQAGSAPRLEAHAWLTVGHRVIVGGEHGTARFAPVACFVRPVDTPGKAWRA